MGAATLFTYDQFGRIIKQTDSNRNENTFSYDLNGNQIKQTDVLGNSTWNGTIQIQKILPNRVQTEYTYNTIGKLVKQTESLSEQLLQMLNY